MVSTTLLAKKIEEPRITKKNMYSVFESCIDVSADFNGVYDKVLLCKNKFVSCALIYKHGRKTSKCDTSPETP